MKFRKYAVLALILTSLVACDNKPNNVHGYELVWEDDFDSQTLNESNWNYMLGDGSDYNIPGWGNNELQYYRKENVSIQKGNLVITAKKESFGNKEYTSARINSKGKVSALYGRIEARMSLPLGNGLWPAFWMLPEADTPYGEWPHSGEIDIMEARGRVSDMTSGALHYSSTGGGEHLYQTKLNIFRESTIEDYHIYAVEWDENEMRWYADDNNFMTIASRGWHTFADKESDTAPFDTKFHILFNLAIGGNFDGGVAPDADFESAELKVDYVRIYQ